MFNIGKLPNFKVYGFCLTYLWVAASSLAEPIRVGGETSDTFSVTEIDVAVRVVFIPNLPYLHLLKNDPDSATLVFTKLTDQFLEKHALFETGNHSAEDHFKLFSRHAEELKALLGDKTPSEDPLTLTLDSKVGNAMSDDGQQMQSGPSSSKFVNLELEASSAALPNGSTPNSEAVIRFLEAYKEMIERVPEISHDPDILKRIQKVLTTDIQVVSENKDLVTKIVHRLAEIVRSSGINPSSR